MTNLRVVINEILKEKKDVLLSVLFGFIAGMAAIGLFSASGYLLSKAAIGVPLTALTVVIAIVKLLGVTRAFSRYGRTLLFTPCKFYCSRSYPQNILSKTGPVILNPHAKISIR